MINELKTFIAVVEHNNFTKASHEINLSQPSVSLHVKYLENYFNTLLIQRSVKQKQIHITQSGNLLYERAKKIIKLLEETKIDLSHDTSAVKGSLHIGASYTIGEYLLPEFLGHFSKIYPDLELEITIENSQSICEKVESFKVDLALVEGTISSSNLQVDCFYKDKMVLALPYEHPLSQGNFSIENLQNQRWVSRELGSGTREYLNLFLSNNSLSPKNIIVFGSNYSVQEAVKNGLGVTFISSLIAEPAMKNKELSILQTKDIYTRPLSYVMQKGILPSKVVTVFLEALKDYMKKK